MCHVCAILVANTTEICAGGLINAALRVRRRTRRLLWYEQGTTSQSDFCYDTIFQNSGSSVYCACRHPRDTIHEVWALVNDQRERSLNSGVQRKYYPDVVQPKLILHAAARLSASHRRPSAEPCGHNILPFLPSIDVQTAGQAHHFFGWQSAYFHRRLRIQIQRELARAAIITLMYMAFTMLC
ncbi:hypothetical protein CY34DRAFT_540792 [Suillus luteus UH-Slu-Lm8-n1]|uniref:Uncharacterized protein n=1 Tax=Suillus luteus UH-Slu-Lm8-n1 TaxID=930992 RepID=A0A0D0A5E5_9AGAM|nr:hypothetical protein CY34DRAFT_540792 [Suillus luteus UH-Slu-Lm8-n1]